jgi:hypothetical protein
MANPLHDTDAASLALLDSLYARMTPAQKLDRVRDLTLATARLALAGLRARHPGETEETLLLRLACLRLGPSVVREVYSVSFDDDDP